MIHLNINYMVHLYIYGILIYLYLNPNIDGFCIFTLTGVK